MESVADGVRLLPSVGAKRETATAASSNVSCGR